MKLLISDNWRMSHEFACHSQACAPPPVGAGGSNPNAGNNIEKDVYVHTLKWKSQPSSHSHKVHVAANHPDYEIHTNKGMLGTSYNAKFKGQTFSTQTTMHAAKTAVEMHLVGHTERPVRFWNIPKK